MIGQLQRQLAEAVAAESYPRSHPVLDMARASPSFPVSRRVQTVEVCHNPDSLVCESQIQRMQRWQHSALDGSVQLHHPNPEMMTC